MRKNYLCMITVLWLGVFCLGIAGQSLMAYPLDETKGKSLKCAAFSLYTTAIDFIEQGNYDQAIAYFNKALEKNPRYAKAYNNRGVAYAEGKGQYDKAISNYSKAIEINPRYAAAYNNRGVAWENKDQYDKAISDFTRAIEINPRYVDAYSNRGVAYARGKGQYYRAISDFTRALEINPWNGSVYENRGVTYENLGDIEKACSDWKRACQFASCGAYEEAKRKGGC